MLASYISNFATRVTAAGRPSCSEHPWEFYCYVRHDQEAGTALQLPEVLLQVFRHLDSTSLCTSVPLVCKQWCTAAADRQLWIHRLPERIVAAVAAEGTVAAPPAHSLSRHSHSSVGSSKQPSWNLALLHQAIYNKNLLRNPNFLQPQNSDCSRFILPRLRAASRISSSVDARSGRSIQCSVISGEQRRLAWANATTEPDCVSWQCPPTDIHPAHPPPPPPTPYPSYNSSSSGSSRLTQQLQGWLQGIKATAAAVAASGLMLEQPVQPQQGVLSCLATGSSWGEVVQVIDLLEELVMRGLPPSLAAALLDSGALVLGLSVWAAAPNNSSRSSACGAADPQGARTVHPQSSHKGSSSNSNSNGGTSGEADPLHTATAAGRAAADDAALAAMRVALMLDDGRVPLKSFQTFVRRESSHHYVSQRVGVAPGGWRRYTYLLPSCPQGCRRAVVLLRGRGPLQGIAAVMRNTTGTTGSGCYDGVKFASAELMFVKQQDVPRWQQGSVVLM